MYTVRQFWRNYIKKRKKNFTISNGLSNTELSTFQIFCCRISDQSVDQLLLCHSSNKQNNLICFYMFQTKTIDIFLLGSPFEVNLFFYFTNFFDLYPIVSLQFCYKIVIASLEGRQNVVRASLLASSGNRFWSTFGRRFLDCSSVLLVSFNLCLMSVSFSFLFSVICVLLDKSRKNM